MYRNCLSGNASVTLSIAFLVLTMASCTSTKNLNYFQDLPNTTVVDLPRMAQDERIIENGDDLYIGFTAKDNAAAAYFNKSAVTPAVSTGTGVAGAGETVGGGTGGINYKVDPNGYLELPQIGRVKATGLTARQLKESLTKAVTDKLKEPIIDVQFNTFRISVIGDVRNPGTFILPMQRPTILEALAAAGDLALTAQRHDVQLYRDYNNQRKIIRIDLRRQDVLTNPDVFMMKHNDVLIVKPSERSFQRENLGVVTAATGVVISLITLGFIIANN